MKARIPRGHFAATLLIVTVATAPARELNVSLNGDDAGDGSTGMPYRTISAAALVARPGDTVTVHAGVYRERIDPPRGGTSDQERIVYQAAPGEKVSIKGSEPVANWVKVQEGVWKATLPNSLFGSFNPYSDVLHGDWYNSARPVHTGAVYIDGVWMPEAANLQEVMDPKDNASALWFARVDEDRTTIWARFGASDPNPRLAEVNVRQTVFYPSKTGIDYITVRGFTLEQAATPWAPPTAEQIGLIGPHWSKSWIIEDNIIRSSVCSGVSLGKYGDAWDNKAGSAEGYVGTIKRALEAGWSKGRIGHHVVRNNDISHCEQAGIVGSLGGVFSTVSGNDIHDIHVLRLFGGAEMGGIKLHGAIDVQIVGNHIHDNRCPGLWLDWMAQGTRVSRNLFHDNGESADLQLEADNGPILVDENIFLSERGITSMASGVAFVHNLFGSSVLNLLGDRRETPFFKPHSTDLAGFHDIQRGDDRYCNNVFAAPVNLSQYDDARIPPWMEGNVFFDSSKPSVHEAAPLVRTGFDPTLKLVREADGWYIKMDVEPAWNQERTRRIMTTILLGRATVADEAFERPDGQTVAIDTDYFGKARNAENPSPGPFEGAGGGVVHLKVWPASRVEK